MGFCCLASAYLQRSYGLAQKLDRGKKVTDQFTHFSDGATVQMVRMPASMGADHGGQPDPLAFLFFCAVSINHAAV